METLFCMVSIKSSTNEPIEAEIAKVVELLRELDLDLKLYSVLSELVSNIYYHAVCSNSVEWVLSFDISLSNKMITLQDFGNGLFSTASQLYQEDMHSLINKLFFEVGADKSLYGRGLGLPLLVKSIDSGLLKTVELISRQDSVQFSRPSNYKYRKLDSSVQGTKFLITL